MHIVWGGERQLGTKRQFTGQKVTASDSGSTSCHKANRKLIVTLDYKGLHAPQKKNKTPKWAQSGSRRIRGLMFDTIVLFLISHWGDILESIESIIFVVYSKMVTGYRNVSSVDSSVSISSCEFQRRSARESARQLMDVFISVSLVSLSRALNHSLTNK